MPRIHKTTITEYRGNRKEKLQHHRIKTRNGDRLKNRTKKQISSLPPSNKNHQRPKQNTTPKYSDSFSTRQINQPPCKPLKLPQFNAKNTPYYVVAILLLLSRQVLGDTSCPTDTHNGCDIETFTSPCILPAEKYLDRTCYDPTLSSHDRVNIGMRATQKQFTQPYIEFRNNLLEESQKYPKDLGEFIPPCFILDVLSSVALGARAQGLLTITTLHTPSNNRIHFLSYTDIKTRFSQPIDPKTGYQYLKNILASIEKTLNLHTDIEPLLTPVTERANALEYRITFINPVIARLVLNDLGKNPNTSPNKLVYLDSANPTRGTLFGIPHALTMKFIDLVDKYKYFPLEPLCDGTGFSKKNQNLYYAARRMGIKNQPPTYEETKRICAKIETLNKKLMKP